MGKKREYVAHLTNVSSVSLKRFPILLPVFVLEPMPKKPAAKVKPRSYRPTKAELEADMSIQARLNSWPAPVMRPVRVKKAGK